MQDALLRVVRYTAIWWLAFASAVSFAKDDSPHYQWSREIKLPDLTAATIIRTRLDSHIYEFTQRGYADLQVVIGETPVGSTLAVTTKPRGSHLVDRSWTAEKTTAQLDSEKGLRLEYISREPNPVPEWLKIHTPLHDFEHQVQVETSADGKTWTPLDKPALIFDYSRYVDARNVMIHLPETGHRYVRLTIVDVTAEQESQLLDLQRQLVGKEETSRSERVSIQRRPFRIDRVEFQGKSQQSDGIQSVSVDYSAEKFEVALDSKRHCSLLTFQTRREPITSVRLSTEGTNFSRLAHLEVSVDGETGERAWREISQGNLTRLDVGSLHREDLTLNFYETRNTSYRIVVENHDSPPVNWNGVTVSGPANDLIFLANPQDRVTLRYGSPDASSRKFDQAALELALRSEQLALSGELGEPLENAAAPLKAKPPASWQPWNDKRCQLALIVGCTLLLAWALFRAAKRITPPNV
jgi:hypothetical protein